MCIGGDDEDAEEATEASAATTTEDSAAESVSGGSSPSLELQFWDVKARSVVNSNVQVVILTHAQVLDFDGKEATVKDIVGQKLTVLIMLRHFGCLICRDVAAKLLSVRLL